MSLKPSVNSKDHVQGNANADLVIVEYGDYQFPYCGAAYPVLKALMKEFGSQVKFVFRNFPLSEMRELQQLRQKLLIYKANFGKCTMQSMKTKVI